MLSWLKNGGRLFRRLLSMGRTRLMAQIENLDAFSTELRQAEIFL